MSTLKTVNIQHPSSASVNAGTDTSGNFLINSGYGSAATAYGCRAWVNFNGTGTVAIRASGNVTSITDNSTGDYTVNFTTAMPDANYSAVLGVNQAVAGNRNTGISIYNTDNSALTTTSVRVQTGTPSNGAAVDMGAICVSIFR